jgi:hypothetical protein
VTVVVYDESVNSSAANLRENNALVEAARLLGYRTYPIPADIDSFNNYEDAFSHIPSSESLVEAVWVGYIPSLSHYTTVYDHLFRKNVRLVNSPSQHQLAMEFDKFYPLLVDITPKSVVIENVNDVSKHMADFSFPVFVKGLIKSNKALGVKSVMAEDPQSLRILVESILNLQKLSRGKVVIREFVHLRHSQTDGNMFPISREYRLFVYNNRVFSHSFYWDEYDDPFPLNTQELETITRFAQEVSNRLKVPFISVDVAQLENGNWTVIETADGQFSGLSHLSPLIFWNKLKDAANYGER